MRMLVATVRRACDELPQTTANWFNIAFNKTNWRTFALVLVTILSFFLIYVSWTIIGQQETASLSAECGQYKPPFNFVSGHYSTVGTMTALHSTNHHYYPMTTIILTTTQILTAADASRSLTNLLHQQIELNGLRKMLNEAIFY